MKKWKLKVYNSYRARHTLGQRRKNAYQFTANIHPHHTSYFVRYYLRRGTMVRMDPIRYRAQERLRHNKN